MRLFFYNTVILLLFSCSSGVQEEKYSLPEDSPSVKAKINIANNKYVLYQVCGYSCNTPGVLSANRTKCYAPYIKIETLDGTGDVIYSDEHMEFKAAAAKYSEEHNILISRHLDSTNNTDCKNGEDWGQAINDIHKQTKAKRIKGLGSGIGYDLRDPKDLEIFLPVEDIAATNSELRGIVCDTLHSYNIYQTVNIENMKNEEQFSCNE